MFEITFKGDKNFFLNNVYTVDNLPTMGNSLPTTAETKKWSHLDNLPLGDKIREIKLVIGLMQYVMLLVGLSMDLRASVIRVRFL